MPAALERPKRLHIMLTAEELRAVDDFRFQKRMPSRAAAVRELMKRGLSAAGFPLAADHDADAARAEDGDDGKSKPADSCSRS
jgi:hypothetical protein